MKKPLLLLVCCIGLIPSLAGCGDAPKAVEIEATDDPAIENRLKERESQMMSESERRKVEN